MQERIVLALAPAPGTMWRESQSYRRLLSWASPAAAAMLREAPVVNVWRSGDARSWGRTRLAREGRLPALWGLLERNACVLSLGARPAWLVWGEEWAPWSVHHYQRSGSSGVVDVVVVPHPSGRNPVHNGPEARERTACFLEYWATDVASVPRSRGRGPAGGAGDVGPAG